MRKLLLTPSTILYILCGTTLYFFLPSLLLNFSLLNKTAFTSFPLLYKIAIFQNALLSTFVTNSSLEILLLFLTSLLFGINIILLTKAIRSLFVGKQATLSVGGPAIISLVLSGCSSCGVSILSVLGLGGALSALPIQGIYFKLGAIFLLLFSLYSLRKTVIEASCQLPQKA